jgi:hypothetical protein
MSSYPQVNGIYHEEDGTRWSPLLYVIALTIKGLRLLSLFEWIKALVFKKASPAWFLEAYLFVLWVLTASFFVFFSENINAPAVIVFCFVLISQVVQANTYHELFRPSRLNSQGKDSLIAHNRLRSLVLGICNYNYVTFLYGVVYWKMAAGFKQPALHAIGDFIYFSYTVAWSVGSRGIAPESVNCNVKAVVVSQIVATLLMVGIIIATAVSSVRLVGEKPRSTTDSLTKE